MLQPVPVCVLTSVDVIVTVAEQASVAVAVPVAAGAVDAAQETDTLAGQVMVGGVVSTTFIVCTQLLKLPQASVALQVRVII